MTVLLIQLAGEDSLPVNSNRVCMSVPLLLSSSLHCRRPIRPTTLIPSRKHCTLPRGVVPKPALYLPPSLRPSLPTPNTQQSPPRTSAAAASAPKAAPASPCRWLCALGLRQEALQRQQLHWVDEELVTGLVAGGNDALRHLDSEVLRGHRDVGGAKWAART